MSVASSSKSTDGTLASGVEFSCKSRGPLIFDIICISTAISNDTGHIDGHQDDAVWLPYVLSDKVAHGSHELLK